MKFDFVLEKRFESNGHIHVYSPGTGTDNPLSTICCSNIAVILTTALLQKYCCYLDHFLAAEILLLS